MSGFTDCKEEVLETLYSCFMYLCAQKLCSELRDKSTKAEDKLIQLIKDTVMLFASALKEDNND